MIERTLFVYGTLKQGYRLHSYYLADAEFVGKAHTKSASWKMLQRQGVFYPFVTRGTNHIGGELYNISEELAHRITEMEAGAGYDVLAEQFVLENGTEVTAVMFWMDNPPQNVQMMGFVPNSRNIVTF